MQMLPVRRATPLDQAHPCFGCPVRSLAVCAVLDGDELNQFKHGGPDVRRAAGQAIFLEGDEATHVYTLTSGALRLSKLLADGRRQIAGFLFPGDFLGITMEDEHAFTAEAIVDSTLCQFPRARFDGFVDSHPHLERRLYAVAAHELAAARNQLVLLGRKTATERVVSFLLMLDERARDGCRKHGGEPNEDIDLPMSRADIADYLGLRIETISRELSSLKAARLIRLTGTHRLHLVDRERLEEIAEG